MSSRNKNKSQFKGIEAKNIADKFNIDPDLIPDELRSYTIPSGHNTIKVKKITLYDIKWFIDRLYYHFYGTYKFDIKNITIEKRYDTNLLNYTKEEFIEYYGIDNYLLYWNTAPSDITGILNEKRYDSDLNKYSLEEFIEYYGIDNYFIHWDVATEYLINDVYYDLD